MDISFIKDFLNLKIAYFLDAIKVKSPILYIIIIFIGSALLVPLIQYSTNCKEIWCQTLNYISIILIGVLGSRTTSIIEEAKNNKDESTLPTDTFIDNNK